MNFEERSQDLLRDLVLQSLVDRATGVVGYVNVRALIAAALEEAFEAGQKDGYA